MSKVMALDVGEKRIGVAIGNFETKIASPLTTIEADGQEIQKITTLLDEEEIDILVVGLPRNSKGEETKQTAMVRTFAEKLMPILDNDFEYPKRLIYQDESLSSVIAEERLKESGVQWTKADVDKEAAAIILQDFLEKEL
ncbi:MAG: Holliday junction resolvase RuvX [Candidatus Nomurabacteria bacterium]|jgi:putative Holliday junction resolvase|nr:Holliday junction resolvase RuvX [Candidatus Nomurabacteria bacterium]